MTAMHSATPVPPRLHLSKSRYLAGLQCERRLWLTARRPELRTPPDAAQQAVFDQGHRVGELAHRLFPGGVLVEEGPDRLPEALERTRALLADPSVPAIFEAAFVHGEVQVRVDVLERLGRGVFGLREVKSAASVHPEHLHDVAVQRWVLESCGLAVPSVELVLVDTEFVRPDGPEDAVDWGGLFAREDVSRELGGADALVPDNVTLFHGTLAAEDEPDVEPGRHCTQPYACEFWDRCTAAKPADWVFTLPGVRRPRLAELDARGIERIAEIPDDVLLSELQHRAREALRTGEAWVSRELGVALRVLEPPLWYLDFEAAMPAVPVWPGTRPYEQVPFQWSLQHGAADGTLSQRSFLAEGDADPRRAFAESLIEALCSDDAPVTVWSSYEDTRLKALAEALPDLGPELQRLRHRLVDLYALTRAHVYHPEFRGSFSIKNVAPALAPGFGWSGLGDVAEGGAAAASFAELARGGMPPEAAERTRRELLAYCERDTLAMVEVHRALREMTGGGARE